MMIDPGGQSDDEGLIARCVQCGVAGMTFDQYARWFRMIRAHACRILVYVRAFDREWCGQLRRCKVYRAVAREASLLDFGYVNRPACAAVSSFQILFRRSPCVLGSDVKKQAPPTCPAAHQERGAAS